jgi:hypothetical protein
LYLLGQPNAKCSLKPVEDAISAEAAAYMKYYETGEYVLQLFALSLLSPVSDRVGHNSRGR